MSAQHTMMMHTTYALARLGLELRGDEALGQADCVALLGQRLLVDVRHEIIETRSVALIGQKSG